MTNRQTKDDGLEKRLPGAGGFSAASEIDRGPLAKRCVARVWHDGGPGSGVLLPGNWFLTNHHVLPTAERAKDAVAQFNYERQPDGLFAAMKQFRFDPDAGFHTSRVDGGDDWTVVKLKGDANTELGALTLAEVALNLDERVSIIQHPAAGPRQVAEGPIIEVVESPRRRIRYRVDTLPGSSGSPVFNRHWQVVGLHHAGATSRDPQTGDALECNEGIHIAALLDGLKQVGVWPHRAGLGDTQLPDGSWNIERKADRDALKHLQRLRITVALKGGSQMGKSFIADRVKRQLAAKGWQPVHVDLRHEFAEADYETGHGFLRRLAEKVAEQTNSDAALLAAFDGDGTPTAFTRFMEHLKLDRGDYRLLITLDRVDGLVGRPCCSTVLSGLRVAHNTLTALRHEAWFQMLLLYTITPRPSGPLESIFDAAQVIEVTDFSEGELQRLAELYGRPGVDGPRLLAFLGGHPTLTRLAFLAMQDDGVGLDQIIEEAKTGGIFKQHLDRLTEDFRKLPDAKQLAGSFRAFVQGKPLDSVETFEALLALGVVKGTYSGDAAVRCELYKAWLPPRIPK